MVRSILIAGNWKMNGTKAESFERISKLNQLLKAKTSTDILISPPFTLLSNMVEYCKDTSVKVGAQDCHFADKGAHTGDISANMLSDIGCSYVILGHSERRTDHNESSELIQKKIKAAFKSNLKVILCIGESAEEKEKGITMEILQQQLKDSIPTDTIKINTNLVIAYEPIWAIGTSVTPTTAEIQATHQKIRKYLQTLMGDKAETIQILYGGSLKPSNAKEILALDDVDGGLIGGASLVVEDFISIIDSI